MEEIVKKLHFQATYIAEYKEQLLASVDVEFEMVGKLVEDREVLDLRVKVGQLLGNSLLKQGLEQTHGLGREK